MLLEYQAGNTLLHRLSPGAKFVWGMIVLLWLFLMFHPGHVLLLGVAILGVAKWGAGLSLARLLKTVLALGVAGIFIVVLQGLLYPGETVLFTLGTLRPTLEGVSVGSAIALRILGIVATSMIIAKTTDPRDIFLTLIKVGVPYKIAYGLFTALRFIPLMEYEAQTIRDAQFVRGIAQQKGGVKSRLNQWSNFLVPLIGSGMRRADQSAIAMEVRAFGLYPQRSYIHDMKASSNGGGFLAIWFIAFILYLLLIKVNVLEAVIFNPPMT